MGELIEFESLKRKKILGSLEEGKEYTFRKGVRVYFTALSGKEFRNYKLIFNSGRFVRFDEENDCVEFIGKPWLDITRIGRVFFLVPMEQLFNNKITKVG